MTPPGIPASTRASYNFRAVNGASLVGLKTTVLPAIKAPAIIVVASDNGKLNGEITAQAPYGQDALTVLTRNNALHRPDIALILLHQARVVVQEVYGFIGLGDCLVPILRNLVRHERSEVELALL